MVLMKSHPSIPYVRCKHPLRPGARFCHICGTSWTDTSANPAVHPSSTETTVNFASSSKEHGNHDLMEIKAKAMMVCLDGEVRTLQKELAEQRLDFPKPPPRLALLIVDVVAWTAVGLISAARTDRQPWMTGLAVAICIASILHFVSARRRWRKCLTAWQHEHQRLMTNLAEKWRQLDMLEQNLHVSPRTSAD